MDTTTISQLDLVRLRKVIQQALRLPDDTVIGGWLPERDREAFMTVDLMNSQEIGQSLRTFDGSIETINTSYLSTVSISAYGTNALQLIHKLRVVLASSWVIDQFNEMNCAVIRCSDIRNLTATLGGGYEERGQIDVIISYSVIVTTPLPVIEKVDVQANNFTLTIHKEG